MAVPDWNAAGLLPPVDLKDPVSNLRSPYQVSVLDVVHELATTAERRAIIGGFLQYRAGLHALGFTSGFQWVNGSFCTDVETLEGRPPGDIDVVTFFHSPPTMSRAERVLLVKDHPQLFVNQIAKDHFRCDAYLVDLSVATPERVADRAAYWSSVWGHTRGGIWKGFLQIPLSPELDEHAVEMLNGNEVAA